VTAGDGLAAAWPNGSLDGSILKPLWLDNPGRPEPRDRFTGSAEVDLLVVGGGFTGLWTALRAVERNPSATVLLIEADRIAEHATGRNGGFCEASLTHGEANGQNRWPSEYVRLHDLGLRNLDEIEATIGHYGIDCGFTRGGVLAVATRPHEVADLEPDKPGFLDATSVRSGLDFTGTITVRNTGADAFDFQSGPRHAAVVFQRGSATPIGFYTGGMDAVGFGERLAPGESVDLELVGGTASCDPLLGYVLPPGEYEVRVPVIVLTPRANAPTGISYVLTEAVPLTILP
jgi:hypothetical protein